MRLLYKWIKERSEFLFSLCHDPYGPLPAFAYEGEAAELLADLQTYHFLSGIRYLQLRREWDRKSWEVAGEQADAEVYKRIKSNHPVGARGVQVAAGGGCPRGGGPPIAATSRPWAPRTVIQCARPSK